MTISALRTDIKALQKLIKTDSGNYLRTNVRSLINGVDTKRKSSISKIAGNVYDAVIIKQKDELSERSKTLRNLKTQLLQQSCLSRVATLFKSTPTVGFFEKISNIFMPNAKTIAKLT